MGKKHKKAQKENEVQLTQFKIVILEKDKLIYGLTTRNWRLSLWADDLMAHVQDLKKQSDWWLEDKNHISHLRWSSIQRVADLEQQVSALESDRKLDMLSRRGLEEEVAQQALDLDQVRQENIRLDKSCRRARQEAPKFRKERRVGSNVLASNNELLEVMQSEATLRSELSRARSTIYELTDVLEEAKHNAKSRLSELMEERSAHRRTLQALEDEMAGLRSSRAGVERDLADKIVEISSLTLAKMKVDVNLEVANSKTNTLETAEAQHAEEISGLKLVKTQADENLRLAKGKIETLETPGAQQAKEIFSLKQAKTNGDEELRLAN